MIYLFHHVFIMSIEQQATDVNRSGLQIFSLHDCFKHDIVFVYSDLINSRFCLYHIYKDRSSTNVMPWSQHRLNSLRLFNIYAINKYKKIVQEILFVVIIIWKTGYTRRGITFYMALWYLHRMSQSTSHAARVLYVDDHISHNHKIINYCLFI